MRLMVPAGRLAAQTPVPRNPTASADRQSAVLRWPDATLLEADALAWVLTDDDQATLSALLLLEWGPRREAVVYGKERAPPRDDAWQLHAQWLAVGARPRQPDPIAPRCDVPQCPYRDEAPCPQPFCPATHTVVPVNAA
jgi:hypothetical protein